MKPYPIANCDVLGLVGAIIGSLGDRLSLLEPESHICQERIALGHGLGDSRHSDIAMVVGAHAWRIPAIDHTERPLLERGVESGVVDVLGPWEPADPLARAIPYHATKIHTDGLVHCFCLSVHLGVERRAHQKFGAGRREQRLPERRCGHRVTVGDDGCRDAVQAHDFSEENSRH